MSEPKEESVSNDHLATFLSALQQLNSELASEAYIAARKSFNEIKPEHDLARAALAAVRQARPLYKPDQPGQGIIKNMITGTDLSQKNTRNL